MNIYHIYITRNNEEKWIALGLIGDDQAQTLGAAFPDITRIETWNGDAVYKKRTVH